MGQFLFIMKITALFILMVFTLSASAQKLSNYYMSSNLENGRIYFIKPFEKFKNINTKQIFVYDVSFLEGQDSVTMNFSYYTDHAAEADSLGFIIEDSGKAYQVKKLFIEKDKKNWHQRYTATIPLTEIQRFYKSEAIPGIVVFANKKKLAYSIKSRKWKKYADIMQQILQVIKLNQ